VHATAVRPATSGDIDACVAIVTEMPEFFTDDVPAKIRDDLARCPAWVINAADGIIGFAIVDIRSTAAAEILWAAVQPAMQAGGVGTTLIDHVLTELAGDGVAVVEVKTLDASANYQPYEATRTFWERRGFVQIDTIDPLPGWQPGNPSAIYVAALAPTR
jgi:N-acetylglutamate synthase-like GNAT family acetyltransferase